MVGILSPEMLEIAWFKAVSLEEPSSWLSLMIIFKDSTLLGSVAALLVVNRSPVAATEVTGGEETGAHKEEEDAGETAVNEACAAVGVAEVEADVGVVGVAVDADKGETVGTVVSVEDDVFETDSDATEKVETGGVSPPLLGSSAVGTRLSFS